MDSAQRAQVRTDDERRQFRRFPMRLTVQAKRDDVSGKDSVRADTASDHQVTLEIENFSLGGLRGVSTTELSHDERLTLTMPPFGTRPQLEVTGRVVRCEPSQGRFDVGVEFGQTRDEPESSPWVRLPDLFYMAGEGRMKIQ
jgi:hypothetical protein